MQVEREHPLRHWSWVVLVVILLVGCGLRFTGSNWGEGQYIHPDEGHMRNTVSLISMPEDLSLYFDTHRSPLNVRKQGHQYSYGTLPLFLTRAAAEWLDRACGPSPAPLSRAAASLLVGPSVAGCGPGTFTGIHNAVVGRALSALADLGTVLVVYLIGRRLYGEAMGLLAASLGALTPFMIQQAHFFTVDSMACFFTTLVVYFSVRAAQSGHWLDFALAGLTTGLAAACKVSAATAVLLVVLAAVQRAIRNTQYGSRFAFHDSRLWHLLFRLLLAGLLSLIAFRVAQPYAFEGPGFFGIRPSPEWFGRLSEIRAEQSGEVDLPSGRQWTDRLPLIFPWLNMVVWGMGLPLGLAAWIGWALLGFELFRGDWKHLVVWGWASLFFLYYGTRWVMTMRYFLPLYPIFVVFAAYLLIRLLRLQRDHPLLPTPYSLLGYSSFVIVVAGALFWSLAVFSIYLQPHPRIAASRWIYDNVPKGATVANEHWDWGLPLRIEGHDPFGGMYEGIEMANYDEDTPEKRRRLYEWLDQADYVFLASNRLYGSIPRLPARYPLTTEYYRALFAGELGFELAADFTSYPALGPFVFPDQENPFPLMEADYVHQWRPIEVRLPPAEEAFSVYDHPRVLIFHKTDAYSRELVERELGDVNLERVQHGMTPRQATQAPDLLRFEAATWADQRGGGTWSRMFDRDGLLNRLPGLAVVAWWAVVTGLGWLAFPLSFASVPRLRDRGYGLSKVLGLLLVAYLTWLAASLRVLPNTRATILRMTVLLAAIGGGVGWLKRDELWGFLRRRWRLLLLIEGLFALLFAAWVGVRLLNPDLWHPVVGGEKPMDFAYLNAVMKSTWFPPYNPWLSGTWINYYYFGFVIVGTLIKLVGTVPAIAYNLAVPLFFALTGVGAFSVGCDLFLFEERRRRMRGALLAGLASLAFAVLLGNLGVVHLIRNELIELGGGQPFPSTIPGFPEAVAFFRGLWEMVVRGVTFSVRPESWYWHPTRMIPQKAGSPIAEFPAFTFLYADLHAHMIAYPLTLLALALAVHWLRTARPRWGSLLLGGLVIGALRPTNTWDYPTYLALGLVALALGTRRRRSGQGERERGRGGAGGQRDRGAEGQEVRLDATRDTRHAARFTFRVSRLRSFVWRAAVVIGLTVLLYLPYIRHYVAGYRSFEIWDGAHTPAGTYLWIYGVFLFPVVGWQVCKLAGLQVGESANRRLLIAAGGVALVAALTMAALGYSVALIAVPVGALAALLLVVPKPRPAASDLRCSIVHPPSSILWLMVGLAMGLSLAVEVVVLEGDVGRMNTVFKFYLQAWMLLAIAAGVSLAHLHSPFSVLHSSVWWGAMAALVLGGALFLPFGIRARAIDRMASGVGLTLDGMAFMERAIVHDGPADDTRDIPLSGDYYAIRWLQDNVQGSPVIVEGLGRREYLWANRVSIYTGLPTVVGWRWHEVQQRAGLPGQMVNWRRSDVNVCYETTDVARAQGILDRYGVRYVYVGAYERAYYGRAGLAKFDAMAEQGSLWVVYDARGVTIYEVAG